jgi:hypothetical protein
MIMRKAFSMITAVFIIVLMSTIAMLVFNLSGKVVKNTTIQMQKEQAMLLARSYTELAVLNVMNYNRNGTNCVENINGVMNSVVPGETPSGSSTAGSGYRIQTRIYYIGNSLPCSGTRILNTNPIVSDYNGTTGADTLAAIMIDVYVQYKDADVSSPADSPWITYHRRTIQKI